MLARVETLLPELTLPAETSVVRVVFNVTRGVPIRDAVRNVLGEKPAITWLSAAEDPDLARAPNILAFRVGDVGDVRRALKLLVQSFAEPVELAHVVLAEKDGKFLVCKTSTEGCSDLGELRCVWVDAPRERVFFGPREYHDSIDREIDKSSGDVRAARRFFFDLDRRTDLNLARAFLSDEQWGDLEHHLKPARDLLEERLRHTLTQHRVNPGKYARFSARGTRHESIGYFADTFVDLACSHFPSRASDHGIDIAKFESAFECFATGRLRLMLPDLKVRAVQPSSGYFFLFGELALIAAEMGYHEQRTRTKDLWVQLGRVMVHTREAYCTVYGPGRRGSTLADYSACEFDEHRLARGELDALLRRLRNDYAAMSLPELSRAAAKLTARWARNEST